MAADSISSPVPTLDGDDIARINEEMSNGRRWDLLSDEQTPLVRFALVQAQELRESGASIEEAYLSAMGLGYAVATEKARRQSFADAMKELTQAS